MMKSITLIVTALVVNTWCYAQKSLLALNEQNKYTYFQVKQATANIDAGALATYLKKNVAGVKATELLKDSKGVIADGGVLVYRQGLVTGQEEGLVSYKLSIDFKDDKYRLMITDFVFTPYQRNRYGVFAPVEGVAIPLEDAQGKVSAKQLNSYLDRLGAYSANVNKQVNDYIINPNVVKENPAGLKKVDTKNW